MITENELNSIKGLMHYLNSEVSLVYPDNITLRDANGNMIGEIIVHPDTDEYVLTGVTR